MAQQIWGNSTATVKVGTVFCGSTALVARSAEPVVFAVVTKLGPALVDLIGDPAGKIHLKQIASLPGATPGHIIPDPSHTPLSDGKTWRPSLDVKNTNITHHYTGGDWSWYIVLDDTREEPDHRK